MRLTKDIHEVGDIKDIYQLHGMIIQEVISIIERIGKVVEKHSGNKMRA